MSLTENMNYDVLLDAIELKCPMPLLKMKLALAKMAPSQILCVLSSDNSSIKDIPYYLSVAKIPLLEQKSEGEIHCFLIQKP
ncbi:sulfurtransferase TusA family protein [Marinomonas agarivorans]|nr:sulfurtransferase TusA family protein [Marinomonas agarivorans]